MQNLYEGTIHEEGFPRNDKLFENKSRRNYSETSKLWRKCKKRIKK